jgi:hypothetical protein
LRLVPETLRDKYKDSFYFSINFLCRFRNPVYKIVGSGSGIQNEKFSVPGLGSRIQDKHPGSATLQDIIEVKVKTEAKIFQQYLSFGIQKEVHVKI